MKQACCYRPRGNSMCKRRAMLNTYRSQGVLRRPRGTQAASSESAPVQPAQVILKCQPQAGNCQPSAKIHHLIAFQAAIQVHTPEPPGLCLACKHRTQQRPLPTLQASDTSGTPGTQHVAARQQARLDMMHLPGRSSSRPQQHQEGLLQPQEHGPTGLGGGH